MERDEKYPVASGTRQGPHERSNHQAARSVQRSPQISQIRYIKVQANPIGRMLSPIIGTPGDAPTMHLCMAEALKTPSVCILPR